MKDETATGNNVRLNDELGVIAWRYRLGQNTWSW